MDYVSLDSHVQYFKINTPKSYYDGDVPYNFPLLTLGVEVLIPFLPLAMLVLLYVAASGCHHYLYWFLRLYRSISKQMHTAVSNCSLDSLINQPAECAH